MKDREKNRKIQVNITIPEDWKKDLIEIARKRSYIEKKDISYTDLIREAIETELQHEREIEKLGKK